MKLCSFMLELFWIKNGFLFLEMVWNKIRCLWNLLTKICLCYNHPFFFIEYLIQNVIFLVKSHVTKHKFWGLLILKSQHPILPNLTWNETWNDTSLKKLGEWERRLNSEVVVIVVMVRVWCWVDSYWLCRRIHLPKPVVVFL